MHVLKLRKRSPGTVDFVIRVGRVEGAVVRTAESGTGLKGGLVSSRSLEQSTLFSSFGLHQNCKSDSDGSTNIVNVLADQGKATNV